ncbi:MAG: hypothetical protein E7664_05400 [Ruminococcaceae bacterium]|nr:hypothetical protein [Oscillospiraceae bacterium]
MEQIYTIPVNEAFEASGADKACGCPMCALYNKLEHNELEAILGASMMEPDIRIKTNHEGFCRIHYDMMLARKNRLPMALTLQSHLDELYGEVKDGGLFQAPGARPQKRIGELEKSCYVCRRIDFNFEHMIETVVYLWDKDEAFSEKLAALPYICLPHYRALLAAGERRLSKKAYPVFAKALADVVMPYFEELRGDVDWFCKKFDYRYGDEPWYNAKDSVERAVRFLRGDLHRPPELGKPDLRAGGGLQ